MIADPSYAKHLNDTIHFHGVDLCKPRNHPLLLINLGRLINKIQPDIVHAHAKKSGHILGLISTFIKAKTIVTIHNLTAEKWWMRRCDKLICVSKTIQKSLHKRSTSVVYNGIKKPDLSFNFKFENQSKNIIAVGTLARRKGFNTLIEACVGLPIHLHIVGDGPELVSLQQQTKALGCSHQVHFYGQRNNAVEMIAAADFLVISSTREGFSYVFAEALSVKTAVISTRVPVACEVISQKYLVPVSDALALRKNILRCLSEPGNVYDDFIPWFKYSEDHFTLEKMVSNTLDVYRQLLRVEEPVVNEILQKKCANTELKR